MQNQRRQTSSTLEPPKPAKKAPAKNSHVSSWLQSTQLEAALSPTAGTAKGRRPVITREGATSAAQKTAAALNKFEHLYLKARVKHALANAVEPYKLKGSSGRRKTTVVTEDGASPESPASPAVEAVRYYKRGNGVWIPGQSKVAGPPQHPLEMRSVPPKFAFVGGSVSTLPPRAGSAMSAVRGSGRPSSRQQHFEEAAEANMERAYRPTSSCANYFSLPASSSQELYRQLHSPPPVDMMPFVALRPASSVPKAGKKKDTSGAPLPSSRSSAFGVRIININYDNVSEGSNEECGGCKRNCRECGILRHDIDEFEEHLEVLESSKMGTKVQNATARAVEKFKQGRKYKVKRLEVMCNDEFGPSIPQLYAGLSHREREDVYISVVGGLTFEMTRDKFRFMIEDVLAPRIAVPRGTISEEHVSTMFQVFDINHDGSVSYFEYLASLCHAILTADQTMFVGKLYNSLLEARELEEEMSRAVGGAKPTPSQPLPKQPSMDATLTDEEEEEGTPRVSIPTLALVPQHDDNLLDLDPMGSPRRGTTFGVVQPQQQAQVLPPPAGTLGTGPLPMSLSPRRLSRNASQASLTATTPITASPRVVPPKKGVRRAADRGLEKKDVTLEKLKRVVFRMRNKSVMFPNPTELRFCNAVYACFRDILPTDFITLPKFRLLMFCDDDVMAALDLMYPPPTGR